ncbi:hypothetical protein M501DRAFT_939334 [Patellaria atrata CBS 101060]|uniref:Uncharacterized protein n=1 Tax=Patellaria atrata CBS 101060 TaxID=1346257 RepID=A0A9P4S609_9PEZI|nr:hypothetical protein M501DRAFT_939334 [Patellaria atrata CBS 101060]
MPALAFSAEGQASEASPPVSSVPPPPRDNFSHYYQFGSSAEPPRPPFSPITPVAKLAQLADHNEQERVIPPPATTLMRRPDPIPISESENTDAIALRSAISILQIQREKSKRDIKALLRAKEAALADPEGFVKEITGNRATLNLPKTKVKSRPLPSEASDSAPSSPQGPPSKFGPIPQPQNVYRCPSINWAKYHAVGDSLDKLHEEQKRRPTAGEPERDPVHVMAAPYSPWNDRIGDHPMQTRRAAKKTG